MYILDFLSIGCGFVWLITCHDFFKHSWTLGCVLLVLGGGVEVEIFIN